MNNWKKFKLGELTNWYSGGTPSKNEPEFWNGKIPWISAKTMTGYKVYKSDLNITESGLKQGSRIAEKDDILLLVRGSGLYLDIPINLVEHPVAFNQDVKSIRAKDKALNKFIFFWLHGNKKALYDILDDTAIGAGKFDTDRLKNLEISIPNSRDEINSITELAESLFDKIDLLHRQNIILEQMAETIFRQWFVDAPEEAPLKYFGKIVCGKTPSKKVSEYYSGEVPFVKIPDMHGNVFLFETEDSLTTIGRDSQAKKTLPKYSICVSCIATVGLVSITTKECQTNQQINSIVPSKDIYRYYLYIHLKTIKDDLMSRASGGSVTMNLNTSDFSNISIPLFTDEYFSKFDSTVSIYFTKIYSNISQIRKLVEIRDSLLPKLMNGTVRVINN